MRQRGWLLYLLVGAFGGLVFYTLPPFRHSEPFLDLLAFSGMVAVLAGMRMHEPVARAPWALFAAGLGLFAASDVITDNYQVLFHHPLPFPSVADLPYLVMYPCLIGGILLLVRERTPGRDREGLLDSAIIAIGVGLLFWEFLIAPSLGDTSLHMAAKATAVAYPLMDLLLLAVVVRFSVGSSRKEPTLALLLMGVTALLVTDAANSALRLSNLSYHPGSGIEAGWLFFYILWGAAALHPSMRTVSDEVLDRPEGMHRSRLVALAAAALMAPAVQAIQVVRGGPVQLPATIVGSVALFGLTIARMAGLVRRHEQAVERERTLREAGTILVAAASREELAASVVEVSRKLAGEGSETRLALESSTASLERAVGPFRATDAYDLSIVVRALPLPIRDLLARRRPATMVMPGAALRSALGLPIWATGLVLVPLFAGGGLRGLLAVGTQGPLSIEIRRGAEGLGALTAMALERALLTEDLHRRASEARFASLVQNSSDVVTVVDAESRIHYQSPSVVRVLGHQAEELIGTPLVDLVHPTDREAFLGLLKQASLNPDSVPSAAEFRLFHADGRVIYAETVWANLTADPNVGGIVLNTRDVSERKAFEEQLTYQAFHDPVTGLANRALFRNRVDHALERQRRDQRPVAVVFMDIDDFKTVNDSLGHAAGDQLLAQVGHRLRGSIRAADTAARLGGDEFAVLLEDAGYHRAAEVAERMLEMLSAPFVLEGKEVFVRASLGIANGDNDRMGTLAAEELLRNADAAMYSAKNEGKGRYRVYEATMHATVLERLELKADLQRAVQQGEFILHYQPIIELRTGRVTGMEALIRWQHPRRGLIPPDQFIPLAEETGLIVPMGAWALQEACRATMRLTESLPGLDELTIAVNLSPRQLQHDQLIPEVTRALHLSGLDPGRLVLEITETAMVEDGDRAIFRLFELKELGIRLAIDDFGTGYSSLTSLQTLPVDVLKADKSFVSEAVAGGDQQALVTTIVDLAAALNLKVVAEGIETPHQAAWLREIGCKFGQGFHYSRPVPEEALPPLLMASSLPLEEGQAMIVAESRTSAPAGAGA